MFPLRDENPIARTPVATIAVMTLTVASWVFAQGFGSDESLARSLCLYALIPADLLGRVAQGASIPLGGDARCVLEGSGSYATLLTTLFMHGGWFHLIGNLWFLWVFGDNVEDAMGPWRYVFFYLLCGLAASAAQVASDPESLQPIVGASGAIGGIMGAYGRLYPRSHIRTLLFLGFTFKIVSVPALMMLGYWFLLQVLGGVPTLSGTTGGVAFWAHVGGFVAGLVLAGPLHREDLLAAHLLRAPGSDGERAT